MLPPDFGTDLLPIPIPGTDGNAEQCKTPIRHNPVESSAGSIRYGNCYWPLPAYLLQQSDFLQSSSSSMGNPQRLLKRARPPHPPASTALPSKRLRFCPVPAPPAFIKNVRPKSILPQDITRTRSNQMCPPNALLHRGTDLLSIPIGGADGNAGQWKPTSLTLNKNSRPKSTLPQELPNARSNQICYPAALLRQHWSAAVGMGPSPPQLVHGQIPPAASPPMQMAPPSLIDKDEKAYHVPIAQVSNTDQRHSSKSKVATHTDQRHNSEPKAGTNISRSKAATNHVKSPTSTQWEDIERMCAELEFELIYNDFFPLTKSSDTLEEPAARPTNNIEKICAEFEVTYNDLFPSPKALDILEEPAVRPTNDIEKMCAESEFEVTYNDLFPPSKASDNPEKSAALPTSNVAFVTGSSDVNNEATLNDWWAPFTST